MVSSVIGFFCASRQAGMHARNKNAALIVS
jgi:hypothetical protein